MARPLRITYPGAFYHITSRGNERKAVFKSKSDRLKFLAYLKSATVRYSAAIHAYCLMDNHYHLLMETPAGNLPQIMRHINGAYTTYYNVKRDRSGHLFQGRYLAVLVERDVYAKELSRYIHLNPVRAGRATNPGDYEWSSYAAYVGLQPPPEWLIRDLILGYFSSQVSTAQSRYKAFAESIIGTQYVSPLKAAASATILGGPQFVDTIRAEHLSTKPRGRDLPALRYLAVQPSVSLIEEAVERLVSDDPKLERNLKIYFIQRYSGVTLKGIGRRFGIGESGVSQVCRRVKKRKADNAALSRVMEKIDKEIKRSRG